MNALRLALALLLASLTTHHAAAPDRPNILFLFADDQRADTIAALGNPVIKTPNLDRLVHRGLAFNRAYMQGGLQGATCVPSRAMLLSGRNLFHIDEKLMRDATWPEAFGKAGYTTFVSGKWHNGDASLVRSFKLARSMFTGGMTNPMQAKLRDLKDGQVGEAKLAPKHACEVFADEAIRFLKEHKDGPFFAYVPFDAPHDPHIVPDGFPVNYDPAKILLPPSFLPQHPWDNGEMVVRDEQLLPWPRKPEAVREMIAEYYRYISYLDSQIGRVLDALDASPYAKNTIVIFAADSGVARGSHGLIGKQNVYEFDSVRVPLIISGPGIAADQRTDAMCYLFDVLPTLGKRCGVPAPNQSDGFDFSGTFSDPATPARPHMLFAYRHVQRALRDERWKLIRYPQVDKTQLFDLQNDPHEVSNLAGQPAHAAKLAELTALLEKEMQRSGDTNVLKVANPKPADWTPPAKGKAGKPANPAKTEPTNAKESAAPKADADQKLDAEYAAVVAKLPPEQQAWERVLQQNLGSFYLPIHKREKVAGRSNAWDFVGDNPKLPRVLLIGDSVSRGYTQAVRQALAGKANVHRAPENCGPTANGLKKIDVWLGDGKWDVIHFNFGIHDRATPLADYTQRLEQLIARMHPTGAKLIWASTTPIPDDATKKQTAASIVERNQAAATVMKQRKVAVDDLFTAITPQLAKLQNPNDVHFTAAGYEFLGQQVAASILAALK